MTRNVKGGGKNCLGGGNLKLIFVGAAAGLGSWARPARRRVQGGRVRTPLGKKLRYFFFGRFFLPLQGIAQNLLQRQLVRVFNRLRNPNRALKV